MLMNKKIHLFGGTHGNERLGVHLVQALKQKDISFNTKFSLVPVLANPQASRRNSRYIHNDLNRLFKEESYHSHKTNFEIQRVQELHKQFDSVDFIIDLHSTTSNMGNSIIITEWNSYILEICKIIIETTPNTFILYEDVLEGSLESLSKKAITLEVGPIGQGVANLKLFNDYKQVFQNILDAIEKVEHLSNLSTKPLSVKPIKDFCYFYRTPFKIDYPRDSDGYPQVFIHSSLEGKDYQPLSLNQSIFINHKNESLTLIDLNLPQELLKKIQSGKKMCPIFIGEAAYIEKGIAFVIVEKIEF